MGSANMGGVNTDALGNSLRGRASPITQKQRLHKFLAAVSWRKPACVSMRAALQPHGLPWTAQHGAAM